MTTPSTAAKTNRLVLVTGPSGAGRSTAINVLEDLGFEAIDNLPLSLIPQVLDARSSRPLAIGLDVRNREFTVDGVLDAMRMLAADPSFDTETLYLDCSAEVLARRYSETRRRHPMAPDTAPEFGIAQEQDLLAPIRHQVTMLVDTTELSPHDLRDTLRTWYDPNATAQMAISVQSFSYKRGVPPGMDMVFDCRFLKNPHWEAELRPLDGRDARVRGYIESDPLCSIFFDKTSELIEMLLPAFKREGKAHLTIGFGCTGGKHRSVALAEITVKRLASQGWQASKRHRELERRTSGASNRVGDSA
jgi:UPF0042 nucleotide-binding protein